MDLPRHTLFVLALMTMAAALPATPIDTTRDLLMAIENGDGNTLMDILSESVRVRIEETYSQLQEIAAEDPGMADELLERTGGGMTAWDLEWMEAEDFVSRLLSGVQIPSPEEIVSERVSMAGRNAEVEVTWHSGYSVTVQLTWEESTWKVTGSSLLQRLF